MTPVKSGFFVFSYLAPVMKNTKWIGLFGAVLLIIACFMPWYHVPRVDIIISGVDGDRFGKPGYWHFFLVLFYIPFTMLPRLWAKQWNLLVTGINLAWMIRNFFVLAICSGGICPERKFGIWLVMISSIIMLIAALFPDVKLKQK